MCADNKDIVACVHVAFHCILGSSTFLFGSNEMRYAESSDVFQIADHAHAILGPIPLIQMLQPGTREAVTKKQYLTLELTIFPQFLILHTT